MSFEFDGRHLMADVLVSDGSLLSDPSVGIGFLETIVERIDMTMILPPVTVKFPHSVSELRRTLCSLEEEGLADSKTACSIRESLKCREDESYGYSTFVMIAESHLSIHTFPELNYLSFDCYSCKYFDTFLVEEIIRDTFEVSNMVTQRCIRRVPA